VVIRLIRVIGVLMILYNARYKCPSPINLFLRSYRLCVKFAFKTLYGTSLHFVFFCGSFRLCVKIRLPELVSESEKIVAEINSARQLFIFHY